jgi:hypothetical protein
MQTAPLSQDEINLIIRTSFHFDDIREAYLQFEWRKERLPKAVQRRNALEAMTQQWLQTGMPDGGLRVAREVYEWGFGRHSLPKSCRNETWQLAFHETLQSWHRADGASSDAAFNAFCQLLETPSVGIATVSKWICFVDQSRYAIYDSRVSRALRHVEIDGKRIFPLVPSRSKSPLWNAPDIRHNENVYRNTVFAYVAYLILVRALAPYANLSVAQVEMALFMMGKSIPDSEPRLPFAHDRYSR